MNPESQREEERGPGACCLQGPLLGSSCPSCPCTQWGYIGPPCKMTWKHLDPNPRPRSRGLRAPNSRSTLVFITEINQGLV